MAATTLASFVLGQNLGFGGREDTIEPAQYRHWQHDPLVLWRTIGTA
jgi:hypothetical protein